MRLVLELVPGAIEFTRRGDSGPYPLLLSVGTLRLAARAGQVSGIGATESTSLTVSLDNAGRRAATLLGRPLRVAAEVFDDADELLFSGIVSAIEYGRTLDLTLEA